MKNLSSRLEDMNRIRQKTGRPADRSSFAEKLDAGQKFFAATEMEKNHFPLADALPGSWINTFQGDIFRAEYRHPLNIAYGNCDLGEFGALDSDSLSHILGIPPEQDLLTQTLFIDTESTGLSNTGGTIAFLIGIGFFTTHHFEVHQYFVDAMNHEEAVLDEVRAMIKRYPILVSFNGKSYDLPLLNSRCIMNSQQALESPPFHIDLLHHSRSLWKYSLENCKLGTLEGDILGFQRSDDIPGEEIPGIYFDFLRAGQAERLIPVFIHNRYDIISMAALVIEIVKQHASQDAAADPLVDYARARFAGRRGNTGRSQQHYEAALQGSLSRQRRQIVELELAALLKKQKHYDAAARHWQDIIRSEGPYCLAAYTELAKYFEHRCRNLTRARDITEEALTSLPSRMQPSEGPDLVRRLTRIKRKLNRNEQKE